jgi:hypothetical protein
MKEVPSDVVELIIAVDLDPKNPSEPINVTSVDANEGKGKGQCSMCAKLFKAIAKMDPEMAAVAESDLEDEEKIKAIEKLAAAEPSEAQDEADSFDKATSRPKPSKSPEERYGKPEVDKEWKPRPRRDDFEPKRDEEDDFEPRKKGGFGGARDRAFGKPRDDEDEEF